MPTINDPIAVAEVRAAFERYEKAVAENDVAVLNQLFWMSDLTLRYGYTEILHGYKAIAAFRSSRNPSPHPKTLLNCVITTFGDDFATANIDFTRGERHGRQSQTWVKFQEGWRIVAAHVSYLEAGTNGK